MDSLGFAAADGDLQLVTAGRVLQSGSDSLLILRRTKNKYVWSDGIIPGSLYFN